MSRRTSGLVLSVLVGAFTGAFTALLSALAGLPHIWPGAIVTFSISTVATAVILLRPAPPP